MPSITPGFEYDIFISYRQKDNKGDRWVSEFVEALKVELESTFKEEISVYFDVNPHDGLLETHDVDASLKEKLKCLIFIPIISHTYCDPKSFAWEHEFKEFVARASKDQFGLKVKLPSGNIASRVLPVQIHELDPGDKALVEEELGGVFRGLEFIYKESGVNRPLNSHDDERKNLKNTRYKNQINKVANALKEIFAGLKGEPLKSVSKKSEVTVTRDNNFVQEKSIIVLPFENISPDADQKYFSDGLTEEIITDLSQINELLVISRSSAMTFKGTEKKVRQIAEEVNVHYVLEGSVRKVGNNLRITTQLIDGASDTHLWAETYNGTLDDVFDIQEKVAHAIVNSLKLKLTPKEKNLIDERHIDNIAAFEYYLKAQAQINLLTEDAINSAVHYLQNALDIVGENALLYSGMAYAFLQLVNIGAEHEECLIKAEEFAKKALSLDQGSAKAHAALGWISMWSYPRNANKHFKNALLINPNDVFALSGTIANYVQITGEIDSASSLLARLNQIDPLDFATKWLNGGIHFYNGDYKNALSGWRPLYEMHPNIPIVQFYYASTMVYLDQGDSACSIIEQGVRSNPNNAFTKLGLLLKHAVINDKYEAFKVMTPEFRETCNRDCTFSHHLAGIFSLLNEKDEALFWLENAYNRGFINWPLLSQKDLWLKNIRGEIRFKVLMEKVKTEWENFKV
jgi:TolB-like protein